MPLLYGDDPRLAAGAILLGKKQGDNLTQNEFYTVAAVFGLPLQEGFAAVKRSRRGLTVEAANGMRIEYELKL